MCIRFIGLEIISRMRIAYANVLSIFDRVSFNWKTINTNKGTEILNLIEHSTENDRIIQSNASVFCGINVAIVFTRGTFNFLSVARPLYWFSNIAEWKQTTVNLKTRLELLILYSDELMDFGLKSLCGSNK